MHTSASVAAAPPAAPPSLADACLAALAAASHPAGGADVLPVVAGTAAIISKQGGGSLEEHWRRVAQAHWGQHASPSASGGCWRSLVAERLLAEAIVGDRAPAAVAASADSKPPPLVQLAASSRGAVRALRLPCRPARGCGVLVEVFDALHGTPAILAVRGGGSGGGGSGGGRGGGGGGGGAFDAPVAGSGAAASSLSPLLGGLRLSINDCRALARVVASPGLSASLVVLDLASCGLGDDEARMLVSGLVDNTTVTTLVLARNVVGDAGARALAALLLDGGGVLSALDLAANQIGPVGGAALARGLRRTRALASLNLRLNRLGTDGCAAVCQALLQGDGSDGGGRAAAAAATSTTAAAAVGGKSTTAPLAQPASSSMQARLERPPPLRRLNLAANGAGVGLVPVLCALLRRCSGGAGGGAAALTEVDVSCNALSEAMAADVVAALAANSSCGSGLLALDVRGCGLGDEAEAAVRAELLAWRAAAYRRRAGV